MAKMKQSSIILDVKYYPEKKYTYEPFRLYAKQGNKCRVSRDFIFTWRTFIAEEDMYCYSSSFEIFECRCNIFSKTELYYDKHVRIKDNCQSKLAHIEFVTGDNCIHDIYFDTNDEALEAFNTLRFTKGFVDINQINYRYKIGNKCYRS